MYKNIRNDIRVTSYNILPGVVVNTISDVVSNDTIGLKLDASPETI